MFQEIRRNDGFLIVIGSTTARTTGGMAKINLPGNVETDITFTGTYYPDGIETQRVGIIPDISVIYFITICALYAKL